jgi:TolA-binding protein
MRPGHCERVWQAEAIEDGRLDGPERVSFEKHARGCSICAKELAAVGELRERMRQLPPLSSTPLEHRRGRAELLRRADARAVDRPRHELIRRWGWLVAALSCAGLALIVVALFGRRHWSSRGADAEIGPPSFEVADAVGAEWISEVTGSEVRAHLTAGAASFHVEHTRIGQRFLLHMPDAQIEVHGTRFRVEVRHGTTQHVEVSEGLVTLQRQGEPERRLYAGDVWDAPSNVQTNGDDALRARGGDASSVAPEDGEAPPRNRTKSLPDARSSGLQQDAFAAAVAAFRHGDYFKAEQLLDRFLDAMPNDARVEDAFFLKAVSRARTGDAHAAAQLARAYLDRFPNGLRRLEAERIAAGTPTSDRR